MILGGVKRRMSQGKVFEGGQPLTLQRGKNPHHPCIEYCNIEV